MEFLKNSKLTKIILLGIVAVGCYYIWKSDSFQKAVFPEKYWQEKVDSLERVIEFNNGLIRSAYRDLKKIQLTAKIDIADSMDSAESIGLTKEIARDMAVQEIKDKIEANRQMIKKLTDFNEKYRKDLEIAKKELAKHKR